MLLIIIDQYLPVVDDGLLYTEKHMPTQEHMFITLYVHAHRYANDL
jgi:hypothetical protein